MLAWTLLILTLPSQPNAVRVRVWRALKAMGCAALRDGAYLLPADAPQANELAAVVADVEANGGSASLLDVRARDAAQEQSFRALFDRGEAYAQWRAAARELRDALRRLDETEARRRLRALDESLASIARIDFFPGAAAAQAKDEADELRAAVDARFSPGEPRMRAGRAKRADPGKYRGRRWATRARPWVDRLACAWLIRRFVDPRAKFVWLDASTKSPRTPRGAIGFDYDGATFSHVGERVTFEVMAAAFGLDDDPGLRRVGQIVHFLDVGGIPVPEAAGVEAVLGGLRDAEPDDDKLVRAAAAVFDALYAGAKGAS
ncbi:chromate resistance protein [Betaproteobacteria bacterium PRO7]|jgi:hypothetical protein|nr:chromate resistance protein [Betaproteobacteria bacterium PRO7]